MSIVSVDNIQPIGSGTTVTVNKSVTLESGNTNITGVCTATSFSGSGANLTSLPSQVTIANNGDNRIITGGSGVNLNGEETLTYDGTSLSLGRATYSSTSPFTFNSNGATGTYNKTVVYTNYNNTSNHVYNGLLFDMGHLTDSSAGEVRKFTIGERGGPTNVTFDQNGIHFGHGSANPTLGADTGLDDYEEGSFSPTLANGNNGYRFQQGTYTKIGNLVTFTAYIETSATPPSGNLVFGSLPFTSISGRSWVFPFHTNRTSFGTASFDARAYMGGNATTIIIYYPVNSSSSNFQPINQNGMNAANASAVWISGSYQTAS